MKKIKFILKIILIALLLFMNFVFILYNLVYNKNYYKIATSLTSVENLVDNKNVYTNKDNKMTLIYFSTNDNTESYKHDRLKSFIEGTNCKDVVNFVDYKIEDNIKSFIISNYVAQSSDSNTVILLNKTGYKIAEFSSNDSVVTIENALKEILKNYL